MNFYYCLSPPACQVEEHKPTGTPSSQPTSRHLEATPRTCKKAHHPKQQYIIDVYNKELKEGIAQGLIPTTVANSAAISGVGTIHNPCQHTGKPSHKQFILPDGTVIPATEIAEYPFEVRKLAKILHIIPGISQNSLLSTVKFADANYITIFDKDKVDIYDTNDTIIDVTKGAILRGWQGKNSNLWYIPLVRMVRNLNTDTVLINRPPSKFLLNQPDPAKAVYCVYESKTQPELVQYLHASAGFPTKPTWLKAIKNKQFSFWPGLTTDAVRCHIPDLDKNTRVTGVAPPADYSRPSRHRQQSNQKSKTTMRTSSPPNRKPSSSKSTISRKKPYAKYGPTRPAVSPSNQVKAISTSWYSPKVTAQQSL